MTKVGTRPALGRLLLLACVTIVGAVLVAPAAGASPQSPPLAPQQAPLPPITLPPVSLPPISVAPVSIGGLPPVTVPPIGLDLAPVVNPVNQVLDDTTSAVDSVLAPPPPGSAPAAPAPDANPVPQATTSPSPADATAGAAVPAAAVPVAAPPVSTSVLGASAEATALDGAFPASAPASEGASDDRVAAVPTPTEAVTRAARMFTPLFLLAAVVIAFLAVQGRLDRRDAKLAVAPLGDGLREFR
jgi:hypothetical protein